VTPQRLSPHWPGGVPAGSFCCAGGGNRAEARCVSTQSGGSRRKEETMSNPRSTAQIAGHPIHPMLVPFPVAFFTATLVCDLVYRENGDVFWFTATQYLLGAGIVMALAAAAAGFTDFLGDGRIPP